MKIRLLRSGALFVFSIVVLAQISWAQGAMVSGSVRDRQNSPKAYVSVTFDGPGSYVAMTDGEGRFTIDNVKNGTYSVIVRQGDNVQKFTERIEGRRELNLVVTW